MKKIILLTGRKHSGKSAIKDILMNDQCKHIAFATKIKKMLCKYFDISLGDLEFNKDNLFFLGTEHLEIRAMLQTLGDWGRGISPHFWIEPVIDDIKFTTTSDTIIIDDCRLDREVIQIMKSGLGKVIVIEIKRDEVSIDNHSTEQRISQDLIDYTFINHSETIEELSLQIQSDEFMCGLVK